MINWSYRYLKMFATELHATMYNFLYKSFDDDILPHDWLKLMLYSKAVVKTTFKTIDLYLYYKYPANYAENLSITKFTNT